MLGRYPLRRDCSRHRVSHTGRLDNQLVHSLPCMSQLFIYLFSPALCCTVDASPHYLWMICHEHPFTSKPALRAQSGFLDSATLSLVFASTPTPSYQVSVLPHACYAAVTGLELMIYKYRYHETYAFLHVRPIAEMFAVIQGGMIAILLQGICHESKKTARSFATR